jgi:hypothetical protein
MDVSEDEDKRRITSHNERGRYKKERWESGRWKRLPI